MDTILITETQVQLLDGPAFPVHWANHGFVWFDALLTEVAANPEAWRDEVERITGIRIYDLHLIDATNPAHRSYFEATQDYQMVIFRKLAPGENPPLVELDDGRTSKKSRPRALQEIITRPITFFIFDQALVTVRSGFSKTVEQVRTRLFEYKQRDENSRDNKTGQIMQRPPARPEELMLRMLNAMVDRYLELRQPLTNQLDRWQRELLDPRRSFNNWMALLEARMELRKLENLSEEQHDALQEMRDHFVENADTDGDPKLALRHDMQLVRIHDVMEHTHRVLNHARRMEESIESAVQLHFSAMAHRTNEIVRLLTVITAIFAPLTLITGIFGMNFEVMPLLKQSWGFWLTMGVMGLIAGVLIIYFRNRRILESQRRLEPHD